ncbi:beta-galactosidase [Undibacterium seohonense]|nr:beta-galactosidase [Undibacterium seohonense]
MFNRRQFISAAALMPLGLHAAATSNNAQKFAFHATENTFLLNGQPVQIRSGEMHPARIPAPYWRHRIQMAKAMGMNTIAIYVMWNYHETEEGVFDFSTENRDISAFMKICQDEGLYVILRPGPYVCGEWDLGGIPAYLLRHSDIKIRANSSEAPVYMSGVKRYFTQLAKIVKPLMIDNGGPILMLQIENEFGSYGRDDKYLEELRQYWINLGIDGPFYTQDGLPQLLENKTSIKNGAIGLSGGEVVDIHAARQKYPHVPVMSGELYPGWLTHWGDPKFQGMDVDVSATLAGMMKEKISFNIYVIHGGTNFGFSAGANTEKGQYQPDITSYDYGAPINEQGAPTKAYFAYRKVIQDSLQIQLPAVPKPIPTIASSAAVPLLPKFYASIWDNLPKPIATEQPQAMEMLGQHSGFILYRKMLGKLAAGHLKIDEVNDYATVHLNKTYLGGFSRAKIPNDMSSALKVVNKGGSIALTSGQGVENQLDILVEAMGRINYGRFGAIDRKGICSAVTVLGDNKQVDTIQAWNTYLLPVDEPFIQNLRPTTSKDNKNRPGCFFKLHLKLDEIGDTYIDMKNWTKGVVWINGHNIGRYWKLGPQTRLYCPASWLKKGDNQILIFDFHQTQAKTVSLERTLA